MASMTSIVPAPRGVEAGRAVPHIPSEILIMILEYLPASFFQRDLGRLTVSKRWYSLAFPVFYPQIELTPRVISRLVHRKSKALDKARARLRKSLRCANIVLNSTGGGGRGSGGGGRGQWEENDMLWAVYEGEDPATACFNTPNNLCRLYVMLHECRELTAVRFTAGWQNRAWRADPLQPNYLCAHSLEPYVTLMTHVTSLDLDLCGTDVVDAAGATVHFCPHLRPLLSRLRALRLRMRSICHMALWPLDGRPVTLGELTVNLYLGRVSDNNPKLNSSRTCAHREPRNWVAPMDELRARMRALVPRMPEPRRAELVHLAPSGEVHVWDAATGVCARDWSEKPRHFPLCFEADSQRPCFHEHADKWEWDDTLGVGGIFVPPAPEGAPDGGIPGGPGVVNHMADVAAANPLLMGMA